MVLHTLAAYHKWTAQKLITCPTLFASFINELGNEIESTFTELLTPNQLLSWTCQNGEPSNRELDRLEQQVNSKCMKFKTSARSCTWHDLSKDPVTS